MAWMDKDGNIYTTKNPKVKYFRELTEEELLEYSQKEWKEQDDKPSDDPAQAIKNKNLTGPKTEEGRRKALQNLRPAKRKKSTPKDPGYKKVPGMTHGGTVRSLLNDDEREYFEERMSVYLSDFEVNESSDSVLLVMAVMDEIIWRRLMLYQYNNPSKNVDKQIGACIDRLSKTLKNLGMTREQRVGQKLNIEHSLSELSARFIHEAENSLIQREIYLEEEEEVLKRQKEREQSRTVEDDDYTTYSGEEGGGD